MPLNLRLRGGGGDGDQPDWTERGKVPSGGNKRHGPDSRAPDWQADPAKKVAKEERDKRERGELVVAVGPFCVPCGKRFAKQSVYDAHLSGKKHLSALQRMGKTEEAMVCQLDVEAKRRQIAEFEEARRAEQMAAMGRAGTAAVEDEAAAAQRRAEREEKLRQRAMLPMPECVTATSVYLEVEGAEAGGEAPAAGGSSGAGGVPVVAASAPATSEAELAAAAAVGSGTVGFSYTSGTQDPTRAHPTNNRFTTESMVASHRALLPGDDWFNVKPPRPERVSER